MPHELSFPYKKLWFFHVLILVVSNYAVQIPLNIFGINTTVGTFTYPFLFLATDLTVRLYGQSKARGIVFSAFIPGLILSYFIGVLFEHGDFQGFAHMSGFSLFVFRIVAASLSAYVLGQIADILVFQRLRELPAWWPAPCASSIFGNMLDTFVFYAIAFYKTTDVFMAEHWFELACADYFVKMATNLIVFLPIYGVVLSYLLKKFKPA